MRWPTVFLLVALAIFAAPRWAHAHPAPFSYLDLHLRAAGVSGTLVVHDFDVAQELKIETTYILLDPEAVLRLRQSLLSVLSPRISLAMDGESAQVVWGNIETIPERQSLKLHFTVAGREPARVAVTALLFPYDPLHQTFVNVYEDGRLKQQAILDVGKQTTHFYAGTTEGRLAVVRTFVRSGIEHILIGPDHVLFLIGLLLLRGSLTRLAMIVTAFTLGHSLTLTLAALDLLSPPARLIEPLIALTIIVVGADNLFVLGTQAKGGRENKDIRAFLAAGFGLIHGFGFAFVLKEFGLPQEALAWSLLAFNVGVEIGQLLIVGVVALALQALARRTEAGARSLARAGSIGVILAGTYWFIQRTFLPGGSL